MPHESAPHRRLAVSASLVLIVTLLAACGAEPRPAPSATALPSGIVATLLPADPDEPAADEARVWIDNETTEDLAVTRLRIDAPSFDGIGRKVTSGVIEVTAGGSAEVTVSLPPVECDGDPAESTPTAAPTDAGSSPTSEPEEDSAPKGREKTTATVGFALGAAVGVAVEQLSDPEGVIAARAALCP